MSEPIMIISTVIPERHDFRQYINSLGGMFSEDDNFLCGTIHGPSGTVWLNQIPPELEILEIQSMIEMYEPEVNNKLGSAPIFLIVIERYLDLSLQSEEENRMLAANATLAFLKRWPSICSNGQGGVYNEAELTKVIDNAPDLAVYYPGLDSYPPEGYRP